MYCGQSGYFLNKPHTVAARTLGADTLMSLINAFAQITVTQSSTPTNQIHTPPASMP